MSKEKKIREKKKPLFIEAISMIVVLLALVIYSVKLDISIIPAMMIAIVWSMVVAYRCGYGWNDIMAPVYEREKGVVEVFFIILLIGAFISTMMFSGTIPVIIYYLINVISPSLMIVLSFLLTAIVSVIIGTSWGTAGTVGVIMLRSHRVWEYRFPSLQAPLHPVPTLVSYVLQWLILPTWRQASLT